MKTKFYQCLISPLFSNSTYHRWFCSVTLKLHLLEFSWIRVNSILTQKQIRLLLSHRKSTWSLFYIPSQKCQIIFLGHKTAFQDSLAVVIWTKTFLLLNTSQFERPALKIQVSTTIIEVQYIFGTRFEVDCWANAYHCHLQRALPLFLGLCKGTILYVFEQ